MYFFSSLYKYTPTGDEVHCLMEFMRVLLQNLRGEGSLLEWGKGLY